MITLQELRAWHIKCATSALGQARARIAHLPPAHEGAAALTIVRQIVDQVEFHLAAVELIDLAIIGG